MPVSIDRFSNSVPALIAWIDNKLTSATSAIYRDRYGIGVNGRRILLELSRQNDVSIGNLSEIIGTDKGTISRTTTQLEYLKLVEVHVNQRDKRLKVIGITAKGRALTKRINKLAGKRDDYLNGLFTKEELVQLTALLTRLHEHTPMIARYNPEDID